MSGKEHTRITDIAPQNYAISLFASGVCNLNCTYCYINKDKDVVPKIHHKIIENINNGSYIDTIKYWFDSKYIVGISHWGSEPTLTLLQFIPFYKAAFNEFENLDSISFSSNLMAKNCVQDIITFCEFLSDYNVKFDLQISLDGPEEITNENRVNGSFNTIISNIQKLFCGLSSSEKVTNSNTFKFNAFIKSTLTIEQFKKISTYEGYDWYMKCFEDCFSNIHMYVESSPNINMGYTVDPTLIYPGDYKKEDGLIIDKVCKTSIEYSRNNNNLYAKTNPFYYLDFQRFAFSLEGQKYEKTHSYYTCSAGDTCLGIDENLNIVYCHWAFYKTNDKYLDMIKSELDSDVNSSRQTLIKNAAISKSDSERSLIKKLIYNRAFSDSYKFKVKSAAVLISYYAKLGMISEVYKDFKMATLLSKFLLTSRGCPAENIGSTGSSMVIPTSYIIIFGNGLFETLLKHHGEAIKNDNP